MAPGEAGPDADAGTLFVVSTPIGNLGDFTLGAIETLKSADMILAEDTRTSRVLLDHYGIRKRPISAREQNEARMVPRVLERLANGSSPSTSRRSARSSNEAPPSCDTNSDSARSSSLSARK
jgi:hypothetical protein